MLSNYLPVHEGQKGNNCVIYSTLNAYEIMHKMHTGQDVNIDDLALAELYSTIYLKDKDETFKNGTNIRIFLEFMAHSIEANKMLPYRIRGWQAVTPQDDWQKIIQDKPMIIGVNGFYEAVADNIIKFTHKRTSKSRRKEPISHAMVVYKITKDYLECMNSWTGSEIARVYFSDFNHSIKDNKQIIQSLSTLDISFTKEYVFADLVGLSDEDVKAWTVCKEKGLIKGTEKGLAEPHRELSKFEKMLIIDRIPAMTRNDFVKIVYNSLYKK